MTRLVLAMAVCVMAIALGCTESPTIYLQAGDCGVCPSPQGSELCSPYVAPDIVEEDGAETDSAEPDTTEYAMCLSNNDGTIEASEMPFVPGAVAGYLVNPSGTTVAVTPGGVLEDGVRVWDFTGGPEGQVSLHVEDPGDFWFAELFPGAEYAVPPDLRDDDILGAFEVIDGQVHMLGIASRDEAEPYYTELIYDDPVVMFDFPLYVGKQWTTTSSFSNASLMGVTNAGTETYEFSVVDVGRMELPDFTFENVLMLEVHLTQTFVIGGTVESMMILYVTECVGELARIVSPQGVTSLPFGTATEFRRLGM